MLIYNHAIYLTLHNYNFFKIKQLRKDKNKMENQEILILKRLKIKKKIQHKKLTKIKGREASKRRIVKINSTIK